MMVFLDLVRFYRTQDIDASASELVPVIGILVVDVYSRVGDGIRNTRRSNRADERRRCRNFRRTERRSGNHGVISAGIRKDQVNSRRVDVDGAAVIREGSL